jgi:alkanesulfonate monooxygenase SsuD/methylene tetrahydromethanopterin reductase-like flavin-dependent oxidoreductase (luciferase family)
LLWHDPGRQVAGPAVVIAVVAARAARIRISVLVNMLARRRIAKVARAPAALVGGAFSGTQFPW